MKIMKLAILAAAALTLSACTVPEERSVSTLEAQGFTNVKLGGNALWGCSEDDDLTRKFSATAVNGASVEGVICAGWIGKGATVRIMKTSRAPVPVLTEAPKSAEAKNDLCTAYFNYVAAGGEPIHNKQVACQ